MRFDTEGIPVADRCVREAASPAVALRISVDSGLYHSFLHSLAMDGWSIVDGELVPNTAFPIERPRNRLREALKSLSAAEALKRLGHLEKGLEEGHWESANSDARAFLNAVFEIVAELYPSTKGLNLKEGAARAKLQELGFFKSDHKGRPLEGSFVRALSNLLGSDGAHTGTSDGNSATFRYASAIITADYFLTRIPKG